MPISSTQTSISSRYTYTQADSTTGKTRRETSHYEKNVYWANGTAANQANVPFTVEDDNLSGDVTYDLQALPILGGTAILVDVCDFIFENRGDDPLTIGPGGTNGWNNLLPSALTVIGGMAIIIPIPSDPGIAVSATKKTLTIDAGAGTGNYFLHIKGRTA